MNETTKSTVIHVPPAVAVVTPYAMAKSANDLFQMADGYAEGGNVPLARIYVYCASIELGLKAAILADDCTDAQKEHLRKLGHDLDKAGKSLCVARCFRTDCGVS